MKKSNVARALVCAMALVAVPFAVADDNQFHWTGKLAPDQIVEIKDISGAIEATGVDGDTIEVTAAKTGEDADLVKINVVQSSSGVTICAVWPNDEGSNGSCEQGHGDHHDIRGNVHAKVDFRVRVPRNLRFDASNVNGEVRAEGMGRFTRATSVNGSVRVSTTDLAEASSVNGSVEVRMGKNDWDGKLKFSSVNGSIEVEMPSNLNTEVRFSSVNGRFESDFPLTVQGTMGRGRVEGTIGNGGRELELKTVNGSVRLRKASM